MQSIRTRFLLISAGSVVAALAMASIVLISLFTRNLEDRIDQELSGHINNIAGSLQFGADGAVTLEARPVDRRFEEPYGGLYWQVEDDQRGTSLRSPSLWDYSLPLPDDEHEVGAIHRYRLAGPELADVVVQERRIIFAAPGGQRAIRIAVAIDASVVENASRAFAYDIVPYMLALAIFLVAASVAQLTFGLRPLSAVSAGLDRIRERRADRLQGPYPKELTGVVDAVNQLLEAQAKLISKAKTRAADLAHGLKTPLTVLSNDAATLRERGQGQMADEIAHLTAMMQSHVDRELTRSRIAASAGLRASDAHLAVSIAMIVKTLKRTPRGEALDWLIDVPPDIVVPVDPNDLQELLGSILDNAVKWSRSSIRVTMGADADRRVLVIEDDGPGASPSGLKSMVERGKRLDTSMPGTGIGLAIVRDIADVYGLRLTIENREAGGLRVAIGF